MVFYLEIVCPVQQEAGRNTDQHWYSVGNKVMDSNMVGEYSKDTEVQETGEASDNSV